MFRLIPNPTFTAAVPLSVPGEGKPVAVSITFRHKSKAALQDWIERIRQTGNEIGMLSEIVAGWAGVEYPDGSPVEFNDAALMTLIDNYPTAAREISEAYMRELMESRAKN